MAQPLTWNESFAIGHEGLDAEHRHLVESINEICAAIRSQKVPEQLADLLKALRGVAVEHIRHENCVLWQIRSGTYEPLQGHAPTQRFQEMMAKAADSDEGARAFRNDAAHGFRHDVAQGETPRWRW